MSASLTILKGENAGKRIPLTTDRLVIGRSPDCGLVIPISAVSREHAQIMFLNNQWFVKDLKSRNKTYVNDAEVNPDVPVRLKNGDRLVICENVFLFTEEAPEPAKAAEAGEDDGTTTVTSTLEAKDRQVLLEAAPAEKLRVLLDITNALSATLELEPLLPKIIEQLFTIFKQADRGFVVVRDEATGKLIPKAIRTRRGKDETTARFSTKIINQCIDHGQAILSEDAQSDSRFSMSQSISDFRIRSVMCAPLGVSQGKVFGVIQLDTQDRSKRFTQEDLQLLVAVSNQASLAMENARVHEELMRRERRDREMAFAKSVQKGFLPAALPSVPGYEFYAFYRAAQDIGGDYYGFTPLPGQEKLVVSVGDVAGKGVPAALLMARLSAEVRTAVLSEPSAAGAVKMLNQGLQQAGLLDRFVTYAQATLDFVHHKVDVVNAGHLPPIVRRANGSLEELADGDLAGLPLGVMDDFEYQCVDTVLNPGDTLLLCSDGVYDAMNTKGEPFGRERVLELLRKAGTSAVQQGKALLDAIEAYSAGRPQHDDITVVCFGRK
jgi:serine phosphatase RsbU (regulator of sigma subunit)/pSer/pThr/pTyr-binding forkhead associated (FHA) protein